MWFRLTCYECATQMSVGETREFNEAGTGKRTAYYGPRPWDDDAPVGLCGVSEGSGDTFRCLPCHVMRWNEQKGR